MERIWSDDDMVELKIDVCDGTSTFSTKVYVGHSQLEGVLADLTEFRTGIYGGICDVRLGAFGPEYASGAVDMRLHFYDRARLYVTCKMEGDYREFSLNKVASRAVLYLRSEPVLLDNFIDELRELAAHGRFEATLEAVLPWQRYDESL